MPTGFALVLKLEYLAPARELVEFISVYYHFSADVPVLEDFERADIAQLRFLFSGHGRIEFPKSPAFEMRPISLFGPRMTCSRVVATGPIHLVGVGILPVAWSALTGLPADKYANDIIDAAELFGSEIVALGHELRLAGEAGDTKAITETLNTYLLSRIRASRSVHLWFTRAVNAWLEADLNPEIEPLLASTGLSQRQVERLCKIHYGGPPRTLIRKYKALRTASAIARGESDWQDYAAESYYDHSHCIRDIKEFTGITPNMIKDHVSRLSLLTFGRSQLQGEIAPLSAVT